MFWSLLLAARAQGPQAVVREIATLPGVDVDKAVRLPSGRAVLYSVPVDGADSLFTYDLATRQSTLVSLGNPHGLVVSRLGDHIAFSRESKDGNFIWSIRIDPMTGISTGPAQRVSASQGNTPSFSPDGKLIAFAADRPNDRQDLVLVSSKGGHERVLAKYETGIEVLSWSADGRWIYVQISTTAGVIERIPAAGGSGERVMSYQGVGAGSIDGRIAFYRSTSRARTEGRIAYVTRSGRHGEFAIPPGSEPGSPVRSARTLVTRTRRPWTTESLNLLDGTVRGLPAGTALPDGGWSPDGAQIALADSTGGQYRLTLANADGSLSERYPVTLDPATASIHWSPNGRLLSYYAGSGAPTVNVLDLATGGTRTVFTAPDAGFIDATWRPDTKSLVLVKNSGWPSITRREVFEAELDGTGRKLSDVGAEYCCTMFLSDRLLLVGADGDSTNRYTLIPSGGGPARQVPGGNGRRGWPGVSNDGRWLLFGLRKFGETRTTSVEMITTSGDSARTVTLPFDIAWPTAPFRFDGQHVILVGRTPGDSASQIFLVPLNGSAPRALATLPATAASVRLAPSPNGSTLVYSFEGAPTSTIYELDLRPLLRTLRTP